MVATASGCIQQAASSSPFLCSKLNVLGLVRFLVRVRRYFPLGQNRISKCFRGFRGELFEKQCGRGPRGPYRYLDTNRDRYRKSNTQLVLTDALNLLLAALAVLWPDSVGANVLAPEGVHDVCRTEFLRQLCEALLTERVLVKRLVATPPTTVVGRERRRAAFLCRAPAFRPEAGVRFRLVPHR